MTNGNRKYFTESQQVRGLIFKSEKAFWHKISMYACTIIGRKCGKYRVIKSNRNTGIILI